jgi:serine/threonine protein kinase
MEWTSGISLQDFKQARPYPEKEVHRMLAPVFDAVVYCHNHGISDQDLKPKKLHFTDSEYETASIKIAGFGMPNSVSHFELMCASKALDPSYQAPETFQDDF